MRTASAALAAPTGGASKMATSTLSLVSAGTTAPEPAVAEGDSGRSPSTALSLRSLVEELDALIETVEMVQPQDEAEFLDRFRETHLATKAKVDRTGDFLEFIDSQIAAAKLKADLLSKRTHRWMALKDRLEGYVVSTIVSREPDSKGKFRPLEGA